MRRAGAILLVVALAACNDKSKPAGKSAPPAASPAVVRAWSWGDPPAGDGGPIGPTLIAAGKGRLVVATPDGCLALLEGTTGKPAADRRCEAGATPRGLAVLGDVAMLARNNSVHAFSLDDLRDLWRRDASPVRPNEPLSQPAAVDGRFCLVVADDRSGIGIECLDPATGRPGEPWTVGGARIAFGERLIGIITSHRPKSLPYADGLELMVELHTVDQKPVAERAMAGRHGPSFVRARPVFVAQTDGERGTTRWIVDRDGRELVGEAAQRALDASALEVALRDEARDERPGEPQGVLPVVDGDMAYLVAGGRVHAYRVSVP